MTHVMRLMGWLTLMRSRVSRKACLFPEPALRIGGDSSSIRMANLFRNVLPALEPRGRVMTADMQKVANRGVYRARCCVQSCQPISLHPSSDALPLSARRAHPV